MAWRRTVSGGLIAVLEPAIDSPRSRAGQVRAGQLLLLISGLVTTATIFPLHPSAAAIGALIGVSVVLLSFVGLSPLVPWQRLSAWATLVFPLSVFAALVSIALADHATAISYSGLSVFCFVYVGVTQPPGTSTVLAPVAATCWLEVQGTWSAVLGVRLVIAMSIWIVVGELLGRSTERQTELTRTLRGSADTDALTGLLNRRGFDRRLSTVTNAGTLVLCDLDHFKSVNDRRGHLEGDRVLADFGGLLTTSLRGHDIAARFGGDEFLIILIGATPTETVDVLGRMRDAWTITHPTITFSTGVAAIDGVDSLPAAIAAADAGLYEAKAAGWNRDRTSDPIHGQHGVRPIPAMSATAPHTRSGEDHKRIPAQPGEVDVSSSSSTV